MLHREHFGLGQREFGSPNSNNVFLVNSCSCLNVQTTRIFAPWQNEASLGNGDSWHEIARPQVHGHDINCVTIIKGKGNHRYVCGADEKVARVFEATLSFLKTLNHAISQDGIFEDLQTGVQVLGANMSALGLSQKPIYVQSK